MKTALRVILMQAAIGAALFAAPSAAVAQVEIDVTFSTRERSEIREFFAVQRPAATKRLPPGIRKNLARGKPLPPGIAKQTLPSQLEAALPSRDGYQRVQVGVDVLLVEVATGIIHDILMDVIR